MAFHALRRVCSPAGLTPKAHRPTELRIRPCAYSEGRSPRFDAPSVGGSAAKKRSSSSGSNNNSSSGSNSGPGFGNDNYSGPTRSGPRQMTEAERRARLKDFQELIKEASDIIFTAGPTGFARALQATGATIELFQEYMSSGMVDPPQVILRKLFERLGATYIKLGQFIASSPSLFPDEYVMEFQKCLDKTDPVPFTTIKAIIEKELGKPFSEVFSSIDPQPLASASVAQVHSAVLKGSGKDVVIKVLRPGTEDVLSSDLNFVYLVTRFIEFLQPELGRLSLAGIVGDIRTSIQDEVDFRKEADHLAQFSAFLDNNNLRTVATCPYVYRPFSSQRILVMDRLKGAPLTDYDAIRAITRKDPESVLISALNTWFASVLGCETFHADVHAGNLMVLPDGRVGFLDFGIVGSVSPVTWKAVEALLASVATGDYETMARALATIGACDVDVDFDAFGRDLESFFTELEQLNTSLVITEVEGVNGSRRGTGFAAAVDVDQTQVNRLFINLVRIGEKHSVKFPREFGLLVKQLLYFDRYTRLLAPSLQVLKDDRINLRTLSQTYGDVTPTYPPYA